ncbi:class II aldolase/adducin family protein [Lysobacter silvisoli]|uniref:Class II aldolase n=1 Tax=Lysobacter silvisoli TaxID=2293254 RepID=A0A371JYN8_9GAMM|nr:class II aldolase/adducin family protein [Lysobacter silvisoli]RDZ26744.1 class II aldolase [Lysobacter silvisoli]
MSVAATAPDALVALSARIGADPLLVQGGGGNTSCKRDGTLWVKASGTWLAQARERDIFVPLPLEAVRAALQHQDGEARLTQLADPRALRPSIETSLHALLPHAVVAHVHAVNTIAWAVRADARARLDALLSDMNWAWVPYRRPGYPLTQAVREALSQRAADVLVLANHGLVVGAADCAGADALLAEVERRLALPQRGAAGADLARLRAVNDLNWERPSDESVDALATDAVALAIAREGALYPDHAVFLGARAAVVEPGDTLSAAVARAGIGDTAPVYALVRGAGVLVAPGLSAGAQAMLHCLALVALRLRGDEVLSYLGDEDVAALAGWEAEAYRRALARSQQARPEHPQPEH